MRKKFKLFSLATSLCMGTLVGLIVIFFSYFNLLGNLEKSAYDLHFFLRENPEPSPNIIIVGITDDCLETLGRWPWDRDLHGKLLNVLTEGEASVIGMDIIFSESAQNKEMDEALVSATTKSVPVVYPILAPPKNSKIPGFLAPDSFSEPFRELREVSKSGYINVTPDNDGIMRKALLWMEQEGKPIPSFDLLTWATYQGMSVDKLDSILKNQFIPGQNRLTLGNFTFPLDGGGRTYINYTGGPGSFPVLPYHLVLEGAYPPETFKDAIVLVGFYTHGIDDYYFTPYAKDTPMYGIEVHANILNTLLKSGPINSLALTPNLALVFFLALGSMLIYQATQPVWGFVGLVFLSIIYYATTWYLFDYHSLYMETVYPLLSLSGSYLTNLVYNFVMEQKDRQRVTRLFGRYVAPQVVDEILTTEEENLKLGGTKREITILFVDIRGFTPLSEKLPPEEVVNILNQYFELVTNCIFENKGTVDKYIGDAVMAIFNAPLPLEDHALCAVKAAQGITTGGVALQEKVQTMSGVTLNFGIGINTGEAVVGNIGTETRMEYTAIGDEVNLAARLESNSKPGQVLVSKSVYQQVGNRLPLESVGEISVKGKSKPVAVYQLSVKPQA